MLRTPGKWQSWISGVINRAGDPGFPTGQDKWGGKLCPGCQGKQHTLQEQNSEFIFISAWTQREYLIQSSSSQAEAAKLEAPSEQQQHIHNSKITLQELDCFPCMQTRSKIAPKRFLPSHMEAAAEKSQLNIDISSLESTQFASFPAGARDKKPLGVTGGGMGSKAGPQCLSWLLRGTEGCTLMLPSL